MGRCPYRIQQRPGHVCKWPSPLKSMGVMAAAGHWVEKRWNVLPFVHYKIDLKKEEFRIDGGAVQGLKTFFRTTKGQNTAYRTR